MTTAIPTFPIMILKYNPSAVPAPVGRYAHGVEVRGSARLVIISGQIPETVNGEIPESFADQCRLVWFHIGAVLQEAGLSFASLVKVTTYLTDRRFVDENGRIRREVLGALEPALTVVVAQTLGERWLLEIEAMAAEVP